MSAISKAFASLATKPKVGYRWMMDATLTGTEQISKLPAGVATASGVDVTYVPGSSATISFDVTFKYKTLGGPLPTFPVRLIQNPGSVYSMEIVFPANPSFSCGVNVDATSGVAYGSQGAQFVTLVLHPRQELKQG